MQNGKSLGSEGAVPRLVQHLPVSGLCMSSPTSQRCLHKGVTSAVPGQGCSWGVPVLPDLDGSQPGADSERRSYYLVLRAVRGGVQHIIFWDTFPENVS